MSAFFLKGFNDVVAADLKSINGILILHMIDHATRFSAASVVKSEKREEIVDAFIKHWMQFLELIEPFLELISFETFECKTCR